MEIFCDDVNITQKLCAFFHWNEDEKVVDIASIMFISEFKFHETVELVEKNIGKKLAGEIADDDAATFWLAEETFALREVFPFRTVAANGNVFHGFIEDDLVPGVFQKIIKCGFVGKRTTNPILEIGASTVVELLFEPPENTLIEFFVVEAHEIALDVKFDGVGGSSVVVGDLADVACETFLAVEGAFVFAAGIGIRNETTVPPIGTNIEKKMMDDTIAKGRGDDFADDRIFDDEGDATTGMIITTNETIAKRDNVFHITKLKTMFVDGFLFAFPSVSVGLPKFMQEKSFKIIVHRKILV